MSKFNDVLAKKMENPIFREEYNRLEEQERQLEKIESLRKAASLTQKEVAARANLTQADISRLEKGISNPTLDMLSRVANALGMKLELKFTPIKELKL